MTRKAALYCLIAGALIIAVSCAEKGELKATWIHPIRLDGVAIFKMNTFSNQASFSKEWGAPRLGGDRRFFRSLQKPGGSILFHAPQKESYILHILSQPGRGKYSVRIQDKLIPVYEEDIELVLDSDFINAGENRLDFLVDDELRALSIGLFPRRITKSQTAMAAVKDEGFFLLPGTLRYYLKPLPGEELLLCLDLGRMKKTDLRIAIKESDRTREFDAQIESNHDFKVPLVPGEFQEIEILLDLTTIAELFQKRDYFTAAISANPYFGKAYRLDQGFDEFRELFEGERQVLAREFIEPFREIISHAQGRPFFIFLHIREPHQDYLMPPPYLGRFQNRYVRQTEEYLSAMQEIIRSKRNSDEDMLLLQDIYDENLLFADSAVG